MDGCAFLACLVRCLGAMKVGSAGSTTEQALSLVFPAPTPKPGPSDWAFLMPTVAGRSCVPEGSGGPPPDPPLIAPGRSPQGDLPVPIVFAVHLLQAFLLSSALPVPTLTLTTLLTEQNARRSMTPSRQFTLPIS